MDLIILVLVAAVIGFVVWIITTKIPMPPVWATVIQVVALLLIALWLLRSVGGGIPNVLR
jgi:hypothetical protein